MLTRLFEIRVASSRINFACLRVSRISFFRVRPPLGRPSAKGNKSSDLTSLVPVITPVNALQGRLRVAIRTLMRERQRVCRSASGTVPNGGYRWVVGPPRGSYAEGLGERFGTDPKHDLTAPTSLRPTGQLRVRGSAVDHHSAHGCICKSDFASSASGASGYCSITRFAYSFALVRSPVFRY